MDLMGTTTIRLPALDWAAPIVDPLTGRPSPYFQRYWQNATVTLSVGAGAAVDITGKVDKLTSTGWGSPTGVGDKTTFATYAAPVISSPPTQAEVQALANHVQTLSQHLKAVIDGATGASLFGP